MRFGFIWQNSRCSARRLDTKQGISPQSQPRAACKDPWSQHCHLRPLLPSGFAEGAVRRRLGSRNDLPAMCFLRSCYTCIFDIVVRSCYTSLVFCIWTSLAHTCRSFCTGRLGVGFRIKVHAGEHLKGSLIPLKY